MSCSTFYKSGLGACKEFREKVIGVILTDKGTTLSEANAKVLSNWVTLFALINTVKAIYIPFDRGYQNNTAEPEITTSNLGYPEKTFDSPPQIRGFGDMSYADYQTFFGADGQEFDVWLVLRDGILEGTLKSDGTLKGYRAKVFINYNAPNADNPQESYPFNINFRDVNEWKVASTQIVTQFSITDIIDSIPVGLEVRVTTAYATGDVTVKVTARNQSKTPYASLGATTDWEVLYVSADLDVAVTAVDATSAAQGVYVLTIKKDSSGTPADLTDDVIIRGEDDDTTNYTHLTQPVTIVV